MSSAMIILIVRWANADWLIALDGLTDCADSDCCSNPSCVDHLMCLASADPAEIALRNPIAFDGASFYQRVKFLVEDNAVQSYAHKDEYVDK